MSRPLLFVDVDGVLNPYDGPCPEGFVEHRLFGDNELVRICAAHGQWLRELTGPYDLAWGTSWTAPDRALLVAALDLPDFPGGAVVLPTGQFDPALKLPAVDLVAGDRPLAWIDDLFGPAHYAWASRRDSRTLLVPIDPAVGLTRAHVDDLVAWANE